jgi:hypothetical protein
MSSHRLYPLIGFEAQTNKPPPTWFWGPNKETVVVILRPNSSTLVLRPKPRNCHGDFQAQITKPSPLVLRLNRETCASRLLHVYDADLTWRHLTSWSSGHRVPDLCLTIPYPLHQISDSCLDPRCCSPCRIRYLHIMRQANVFFQT